MVGGSITPPLNNPSHNSAASGGARLWRARTISAGRNTIWLLDALCSRTYGKCRRLTPTGDDNFLSYLLQQISGRLRAAEVRPCAHQKERRQCSTTAHAIDFAAMFIFFFFCFDCDSVVIAALYFPTQRKAGGAMLRLSR